jgi:hypothetical protein
VCVHSTLSTVTVAGSKLKFSAVGSRRISATGGKIRSIKLDDNNIIHTKLFRLLSGLKKIC